MIGHDHLVAGANAEAKQRQVLRGGAAVDGHGETRPDVTGKLFLKTIEVVAMVTVPPLPHRVAHVLEFPLADMRLRQRNGAARLPHS